MINWLRGKPFLRRMVLAVAAFIPYRARENLRQWILRSVHEADFLIFDQLRNCAGLMLDVGANRGAAALSVLSRTRRFRVIALEPNPGLRWSLGLVWLFYPLRFRYRLIAAGERHARADLVIPTGPRDFSAQASLDRREFRKDYVVERLRAGGHRGDDSCFHSVRVEIRRIDELGTEADVVKIDVEGWEAQVLRGMENLLREQRPALIIELNNRQQWAPTLESMGYLFHSFEDGGLRHHRSWRDVPGLNVICLHPRSRSGPARLLWEHRCR